MKSIRKIIRKTIEENYNSLIKEIEVAQGLDLTQEDLNEILKGYIEAAFWTEEERLREDYEESSYDEDEYNEDEEDEDESEIDKLIRLKNQFERLPFDSFISQDLDEDSKIDSYLDIKKFINLAGKEAVEEAIEDQGLFRLGMDIWLTRNGHGSGFFDHSYDDDNEKKLMDAARSLKEKYLYIGDDNKIHLS
jgi:hypothetical protein